MPGLRSDCLPHKRYLRIEMEMRADAYIETAPMTYRRVVRDKGAHVAYAGSVADAHSTEAEKESVLFEKLETGEERRRLKELSQQEVVFSGGGKRKPSLSTLKRKLKKYRAGGFNAMARKAHDDRGEPRAVSAAVITTAIAAKREQPRRSPLMLNLILEHLRGHPPQPLLPHTTTYPHSPFATTN